MAHISKVTVPVVKTLSRITRFDIEQIRKIVSLYFKVDKDLKTMEVDSNILSDNKKTGNVGIGVILRSVRVTIFAVGKQ
jgi:hypothetical protein